MKEAISSTSLFQIVILFILLFTAIMCLTINNSNAFGVKDELVNIIEVSSGNYIDSDGTLSDEMINSMVSNQYRVSGKCPDGYTGYAKDGSKVSLNDKASVCIKEVNVTSETENYLAQKLGDGAFVRGEFPKASYYQIIVFYQLDIPIINQVFNLQAKGETKVIYQ